MRSVRLRSLATFALALALVAGCQASVATTTPTDGRPPTPPASLPTQPLPTPSVTSPTPSAGPTAEPTAAHWVRAGSMDMAQANSMRDRSFHVEARHTVLLGDGRVLVLLDGGYYVNDSSGVAQLYDPVTGAWRATQGLNKPRADFTAVPLADGRVLVTGGRNQDDQSFSSTYIYDPARESWSKTGLLGTARTAPVAAVLHDGRVLVAGGYFRVKPHDIIGAAPAAVLAGYRPDSLSETASSGPRLADVDPPNVGAALATAELFDPATGEWSATGPLNFARYGGVAVTLADGRVLVAGSIGMQGVTVDDRAFDRAEVYDPETGRFTLTRRLPDIDQAALEKQGAPGSGPPPSSDRIAHDPSSLGSLVALNDGGAVLIARSGSRQYKAEQGATRSFRFDARSGAWTEIGRTFAVNYEGWKTPSRPVPFLTVGVRQLVGAMAARLPDGRVLVAGGAGELIPYATDYGYDRYDSGTSAAAELYDPTTDTWSSLPPLPEPRAFGAVVILTDGSVLLLGGYDDQPRTDWPTVLTSAVRFIPSQ